MKTLLNVICTLLIASYSTGQNKGDVISSPNIFPVAHEPLPLNSMNKSELFDFYKSTIVNHLDNNLINKWDIDSQSDLNNKAIIFILGDKDNKNIECTILSTNNLNGKISWTDQLIEIKDVLFVIQGQDENDPLLKAKFDIEDLPSSISKEFDSLKDLFKKINGVENWDDPNSYFRVVEMNPSLISPPSNIMVYTTDTLKIEIFERSHFNIRVGVTSAQLKAQNFNLSGGMLTISADSTQQAEWKEHLFVGLGFNPWGRGPNYDPRIFNYSIGNRLQRFGIWAGCNLSLNPLDNLYLGLSYDLARNFTINGGLTWNNQAISQSIDVGDITSLPEALKFSDKRYGTGMWFVGISFSPSEAIKILGLGDDDN